AMRTSRRGFVQPQWCGEDIDGKTIMLHCEQGFGDNIQMIRYAPLLANRGGRVLVECSGALFRLFTGVDGIDKLIRLSERLPEFDFPCPLMSLPRAFDTTLDTIPSRVPYVAADPVDVQHWRQTIGSGGLKVGLVWAGRATHLMNRHRSLDVGLLQPLA